MLTGWIPKFKLSRGLDDHERSHHLPYDAPQRFSPDESIGMTKFNGTFVEFVDRTFKVKGLVYAAVAFLLVFFLVAFFIAFSVKILLLDSGGGLFEKLVSILFIGVISLGII